jgi:hypothetical protein
MHLNAVASDGFGERPEGKAARLANIRTLGRRSLAGRKRCRSSGAARDRYRPTRQQADAAPMASQIAADYYALEVKNLASDAAARRPSLSYQEKLR